jgi:tRNA-dihydrouridine synthase
VNLLMAVERHLRRTGEPPTVLGRKALGDPNLVRGLRNGRELRPGTAGRLRAYLEQAEEQSR